ncbi:hypothetical protein F4808DRAFT_239423 [Astrocystis sublimbata]|nr:hypothetical protein F4808DRAFT_239423 [Astrocystis sublimbata]
MSIKPLPDDVIAQIKSSTVITSLNNVICGLLKNCLDAGATKATISVDYVRGSCSVEDDGLGILPAEFKPSGGLGKLHFTSKYPVQEGLHGKHGTFLASIAALSLLSITSHHHKYYSHNSLQIHNSDVLSRHTPAPSDQRLLGFPHGTRVTVRDLFGSMPVRVKKRAIDAERGTHQKSWDTLKRDVVSLLVAWDSHISVSAREATNRWTFSIRSRQVHRERGASDLDLTTKTSNLLYQTQLCDEHKPEAWVPLKAEAGRLSVTGAVSLYPIATKRIQFISIGIRPVSNEHGSNVLYEEINRAFSNSSYGVEEEASHPEADGPGTKAKDKFTAQELRGRKGVDRWPMFYIRICTNGPSNGMMLQEMDELLDERHGSLVAIVDLLKAVVYEFLKKYHFRPRKTRNARDGGIDKTSRSQSPKGNEIRKVEAKQSLSKASICKDQLVGDLATTRFSIRCKRGSHSRPGSPFDLWSRIKTSSPQQIPCDQKVDGNPMRGNHQSPALSRTASPDINTDKLDSTPPLFSHDGHLLRAPFATTDTMNDSVDRNRYTATVEPELPTNITWTNPATKEISIIDPKTGFVILPTKDDPQGISGDNASIRFKRPRVHGTSTENAGRSPWLKELLSSWDNPVFEATEPRIPSAFSNEDNSCRPLQPFGCGALCHGSADVGSPIQGRVSKAALRRAEVIAQVDRKFIFARVLVDSCSHDSTIPPPKSSLLILVDQHAADERCRVESLLKGYFGSTNAHAACTEFLEQPLKFDISARDATQLEQTSTHFSRWGISYHISQSGNSRHRQLLVMSLPPTIAERCRLEPRLLIELLRKESWRIDEHGHPITSIKASHAQYNEAVSSHWVAKLHGCPEGIMEMINSRACRSSIMFNDVLSPEECADLLQRLAECAFPFQCAHGRPSMVPLLDVGDGVIGVVNEKESPDTFKRAFRAWTAKQ